MKFTSVNNAIKNYVKTILIIYNMTVNKIKNKNLLNFGAANEFKIFKLNILLFFNIKKIVYNFLIFYY